MRNVFVSLVLGTVIAFAPACAGTTSQAPPTLSPQAKQAYYAAEVVRALDQLRDAAISANSTQPPLLSTNSTRQIVRWHQAVVSTVRVLPDGWKQIVDTGLAQLQRSLPPADARVVAPYFALVRAILKEVQ